MQVVALACQLVEGTGAEHCIHHDMGAAASTMAAGMAMGGMHHSSPAEGKGHTCRCLGDCHSSLAVLPTPSVQGLPETSAIQEVSSTAPVFTPFDPQFRLPPALGPPHSA